MIFDDPHIWYPGPAPGTFFDLRTVASWSGVPGDPDRVRVRFRGASTATTDFDREAFETAMQASLDAA